MLEGATGQLSEEIHESLFSLVLWNFKERGFIFHQFSFLVSSAVSLKLIIKHITLCLHSNYYFLLL